MTEETWRPVAGYQGLYEVSHHGRVRSVDRVVTNRNGVQRRLRGRVLTTKPRYDGRRRVVLCNTDGQEMVFVASLVLEAFVGLRPTGLEACHNDGCSSNDELGNLRWDTHPSNMRDVVAHRERGERCPREHLLRAPNLTLYHLRRGQRSCLACDRASSRVRRANAKGIHLDLREVADGYYAMIMGAVE